ncbi:MAG: preprotein translocase subunit SecG [Mycoplasmataceae bacterium]|jgi:preprotein translocase subunit SecG|nr:preprotein translocase subunit SecG [Mycoplasmataceae bacterium]
MAIVIVIGLLLSSNGSTGGLTSMNGQDLELFKKTKDKGLVKILQLMLYVILFITLTVIVINFVITK